MSGGQNWGFNSIGAVATEKEPTDSLNLGFPSAYASVYAAKQRPLRYYPEVKEVSRGFWIGDGLQAEVHAQRKKDADYMAGAKVQSTQHSRVRYVSTAHGRGYQPKAVLGQRIFANPSNGANMPSSAREDQAGPFRLASAQSSYMSPGLEGGVLRTQQGQAHGKKRLLERVGQLNAIEEEKQKFFGEVAPAVTDVARVQPTRMTGDETVGDLSKVELALGFKNILASLDVSPGTGLEVNSLALKDTIRLIALLLRFGPTATEDELGEIHDYVQKTISILRYVTGEREEDLDPMAQALLDTYDKIDKYLLTMIQGINLQPKERVALSKNAVKSLGFAKLSRTQSRGLLDRAASNAVDAMEAEAFRREGSGQFEQPGRPREDEVHASETGVSRSSRNFEPDERNAFGYQSGEFYRNGGRGIDAFYAEGAAEDQARDLEEAIEQQQPPLQGQYHIDAEIRPRGERPRVPAPPRELGLSAVYDEDLQGFGVATHKSKKQMQLPTTRQGFIDLAKELKENGGPVIRVNTGSTLANLRKNFKKRLGM
jgi:hypothetical protein